MWTLYSESPTVWNKRDLTKWINKWKFYLVLTTVWNKRGSLVNIRGILNKTNKQQKTNKELYSESPTVWNKRDFNQTNEQMKIVLGITNSLKQKRV